MSEPSNIRINPFVGDGGTTTYINLTETHIIPSVSPYVIRLNEVPEKQDPSNIRAVWVDSSTGAVTASALTEVAATPAAGEFRPDYSTKADGNEAWNTGLIEFSAVDAGKIVQISYTGMGTLAAVQSNKYPSWYTDRGDGSDGDFIPDADCTISGVKNYKSVFIKQGVTVTVDRVCLLKCISFFVNEGILTANGLDCIYDENGTLGNLPRNGLPGGGVGGAGGKGKSNAGNPGGCITQDAIYYFMPLGIGADGGSGGGVSVGMGGGGGSITVTAQAIKNKGVISADGGRGKEAGSKQNLSTRGGGGGGGGGTVHLVAATIINSGSITVNGGKGGAPNLYAGGADGENGTILIKQLGAL